MGWTCSGCGGEERCLRIVVRRSEGNGSFGEAARGHRGFVSRPLVVAPTTNLHHFLIRAIPFSV